jgi:RNA recognition motif-containing protein
MGTPKEAAVATKSLYVGNLPYSVNESALKELFADYDPEAVRVIGDKGFGFVDMPEEMAAKAIEEMNGREIEGRAIVVNEARPRQEGGRGGSRGGGGGGGRRW